MSLYPGTTPVPPRQPTVAVHLSLLAVQICFGGLPVAAKIALRRLSPYALSGLRVGFATPLLLIQALTMDRRLPTVSELPHLALLGILGVMLNQLLFLVGVSLTSATNAAILVPSIPAFTVLVALVLRVERVSAGRIVGVLVSIAGAVLLLRPHRFSLHDGVAAGNLLILINCLSYAGFLVLQRRLRDRIPWRTIIAWSFVFGGAGIWAVTLRELVALDARAFTPTVIVALVYIVLFATVFTYAVNTWAVTRSSAVLTAAYATLQPLITSVLAILFLDEQFGRVEVVSLVLILSGLWQVSRSSR